MKVWKALSGQLTESRQTESGQTDTGEKIQTEFGQQTDTGHDFSGNSGQKRDKDMTRKVLSADV